jgi:glutathione S-transferase/RNA polymerase-associated protein
VIEAGPGARLLRVVERHLGDRQWFGGDQFADGSAVIPYVNGSGWGLGRQRRSLQWQAGQRRPSVAKTAAAAGDSIKGMAMVGEAVRQRLFKREYRDHGWNG